MKKAAYLEFAGEHLSCDRPADRVGETRKAQHQFCPRQVEKSCGISSYLQHGIWELPARHRDGAVPDNQSHTSFDIHGQDVDLTRPALHKPSTIGMTLEIALDQVGNHRREPLQLAFALDEAVRDQVCSSMNSVGTSPAMFTSSFEAFTYRTIVGRSPVSFSLPCIIPLIGSSSFLITSFQRE